ncbi:MAG: hypothetical protein IAG13_27480, partial [Deltaproteobacteria bacterium]|nr:hypothetical protein [Nannocystaceae bacterium]
MSSMGPLQRALGAMGAALIRAWITIFGRRVRKDSIPWLLGPIGPDTLSIGARPYELVAEREGLTVELGAREAGLVPDFMALASARFDPTLVHPEVRRFYEKTGDYDLEAWSESPFPGRLFLWLIVNTVSRAMNQLNFPVSGLDLSRGMASEVLPMKDEHGRVVHTGWLRRARGTDRIIYTGFYSVARVPLSESKCVKVVFPLPRGNATVLLEPGVDRTGGEPAPGRGRLTLVSLGSRRFGDTGFYRVLETDSEHWRVLRFRTLHERFWVYVDDEDVLRCDHHVQLFGMTIVRLHYKMTRK